jgi:hypothetical protein
MTFGFQKTMKNPFHEMEQLIQSEPIDLQDAIRALMSTMFLHCCEECNANLHSDEFFNAFRQMVKQMKLCRELVNLTAA